MKLLEEYSVASLTGVKDEHEVMNIVQIIAATPNSDVFIFLVFVRINFNSDAKVKVKMVNHYN